jgi:hypothetical protein
MLSSDATTCTCGHAGLLDRERQCLVQVRAKLLPLCWQVALDRFASQHGREQKGTRVHA